jgi:hypothetical protein
MEDVVAQALAGEAPKTDTDKAKSSDDDEEGEGADEAADGDKAADGEDGKSKKAEASGEDDDLSEDPSDDEVKDYAPRVQKRIKKLLSQRNGYRRELEAIQPDAESYRQIRSYMDKNNLADEDTRQLFQFGAHLRSGNFEEAFKIAAPFMQVILEGSGRAVPSDLRDRVQSGEITEEMARQVGRERYARMASDQLRERQTQQFQTQQTTASQQAIRQASAQWEQEIRLTDPDFDLKADAVKSFATALVQQHGLPKTPQEAIEYAKQAYAQANKLLGAARPKPKPTRPAPASGTSQSRANTAPAFGSMEEAIRAGLEKGVRG